jgi:hypothetical protein
MLTFVLNAEILLKMIPLLHRMAAHGILGCDNEPKTAGSGGEESYLRGKISIFIILVHTKFLDDLSSFKVNACVHYQQ